MNDLFLVGLALDISGAILLAKGLLLSPRALAQIGTWWWLEKGSHEDRRENRVAGEFGVAYLIAGFIFQAVGYSLEIAGLQSHASFPRLLAALAMSAIAAMAAWGAWGLLRERRLNGLTTEIEAEADAARQEIADGEKSASSASES